MDPQVAPSLTHADIRWDVAQSAVFGRKADYSPGEDNIVRVEVRQLRKRLEEYFATQGKDEPVVILIPKGAYVPAALMTAPSKPEPRRSTWFWAHTAATVILAAAYI
jgi:hypothetical protein